MTEVQEASDWLALRSQVATRVRIFYHADVDGCVSAAYLFESLSSLGVKPELRKVFTHELGFDFVQSEVIGSELLVFLDLPAGSQFKRWSTAMPPNTHIFVYDHHGLAAEVVNTPTMIQYGPPDKSSLLPTCVFASEVYRLMTGQEAPWLLSVGLTGEGQAKKLAHLVKPVPGINQIVRTVAYSVVNGSHRTTECLMSWLRRGNPPMPGDPDGCLRQLSVIEAEVASAITSELSRVTGSQPSGFISLVVSAAYPIANYVASNLRRRYPNATIMVGERVPGDEMRGEVRAIHRRCDLKKLVEEAKRSGLLRGGGGHPSAVGVRLTESNWSDFVAFLERRCACDRPSN